MRPGLTRTLLAASLGGAVALSPADEPLPRPTPTPAAAEPAALPTDLPTALRLADAANPTVAVARTRVAEAYARQRQAELYWLPNLTSGATYQRHDGTI